MEDRGREHEMLMYMIHHASSEEDVAYMVDMYNNGDFINLEKWYNNIQKGNEESM